jgi:hypothetical protein
VDAAKVNSRGFILNKATLKTAQTLTPQNIQGGLFNVKGYSHCSKVLAP